MALCNKILQTLPTWVALHVSVYDEDPLIKLFSPLESMGFGRADVFGTWPYQKDLVQVLQIVIWSC